MDGWMDVTLFEPWASQLLLRELVRFDDDDDLAQ